MPVDLSGPLNTEFDASRKRAESMVAQERWQDAADAFRRCSAAMRSLAANSRNPQEKATRLARADKYAEMAERAATGKLKKAPIEGEPTSSGYSGADAAEARDDHRSEIEALITQAKVDWPDIGGLENTKKDIKTAYAIALARQPDELNIPTTRRMLFYGPPGTGKTLLAAATSKNLQATFFNVKVSNLLSKYFGESTKLISSLFTVAHERAPSVVFLDEIDSLVPPRGGGGDSSVERRVISTLLVELDGLAHKNDPSFVLTIAATNVPWMIDKAMLSRFEKKIYIPLPDAAARTQILQIQFGSKILAASRVPMATLVARTEGFSGREIERLSKEVLGHMISRMNPDLTTQVDAGRDAIEAYQLRIAPLNEEDFAAGFSRVRAETSRTDLQKFTDWEQGRME